MILAEKGLGFRLQTQNPWEEHSSAFLNLNPLGEVPVMVEENGEVIVGNYAITEYLEEKHPSPNFIGRTLSEKAEIRRLVDWFDGRFERDVSHKLLTEKVFKRLARKGAPDTNALREGKRNIDYHLDYIVYLTEHQPWLAGDSLTLADIVAGAHISAMDYLGDVPWNHFPEAKQWYAVLKSRPSFRAILADRTAGILPPAYYDNPDF
jgi:glutathione S-transferase